MRVPALLLAAALAVPGAVSAQTVRGQLTDSLSRAPLPGAFLTLVDAQGVEKVRTITNGAGEFLLNAPAPGAYRLRSKRIGFRPYISPVLTLTAGGTISYSAVVDPIPVALAQIVVQGERQCDVEAGASVAAVWEEVHEALAAVSWTSRDPAYWYAIVRFERETSPGGRPRGPDSTWRDDGFRKVPVKSAPPEQLEREGFVVVDSAGWTYHGPDADELISNEFLRTHCFETKSGRGETAGLIGLAFTPARERTLPDITGTLWIDRNTALLHHLDFTYKNLPEDLSAPRAGGRIAFMRVPSGAWIVRDWVIRMPVAQMRQRPMAMGTAAEVVAFMETGGSVLEIKALAGAIVYRSDSLAAVLAAAPAAGPLPSATIAATPSAPPGLLPVPAAPAPGSDAPAATPPPAAPAPPPAPDTVRARALRSARARNSEVLSADEFEGSTAIDVMALVQEFRPNWLHSRGVISIRDQTAGNIRVYLNGVSAGELDRLRELRADEVRELRHLGPAEAQQRYGLGHGGGVIEVWTK